ncbi:MAG: hypothetical protein RDU89_02705 [bacterium]|nr:hypothetical protein [bacterium]
MSHLWTLYRRELGASRAFVITVPCLIGLWNLFLFSRLNSWPLLVVGRLPIVPLLLAIPWAAIASMQAWRRPWQDNTIYLARSLPVAAWSLLLAKTLAVLTEVTLYATVAVLTGLPLIARLFPSEVEAPTRSILLAAGWINVPQLLFVVFVLLAAGSVTVQMAYLVGRLAHRWLPLVLPLALVLSTWCLIRIGTVLNAMLAWVPPLVLRDVATVARGVHQVRPIYLSPAPVLSTLVVGVLYFCLAAWLLERQVDV